MSLGRRVMDLRLNKGESLQQTADAVNSSKPHIWDIEKGRAENPSMDLVRRLADHFGVSISYLVSEDLSATDAPVKLQKMFRQAQGLDPDEIQLIDDMMQSLLRRKAQLRTGIGASEDQVIN